MRPQCCFQTSGTNGLVTWTNILNGHLRCIIIINIIIRISHFSALAGKFSPILGCIINGIRLGGHMCNLGNFLQLNNYYYYYYYHYY
jgi:hypothetical protein